MNQQQQQQLDPRVEAVLLELPEISRPTPAVAWRNAQILLAMFAAAGVPIIPQDDMSQFREQLAQAREAALQKGYLTTHQQEIQALSQESTPAMKAYLGAQRPQRQNAFDLLPKPKGSVNLLDGTVDITAPEVKIK